MAIRVGARVAWLVAAFALTTALVATGAGSATGSESGSRPSDDQSPSLAITPFAGPPGTAFTVSGTACLPPSGNQTRQSVHVDVSVGYKGALGAPAVPVRDDDVAPDEFGAWTLVLDTGDWASVPVGIYQVEAACSLTPDTTVDGPEILLDYGWQQFTVVYQPTWRASTTSDPSGTHVALAGRCGPNMLGDELEPGSVSIALIAPEATPGIHADVLADLGEVTTDLAGAWSTTVTIPALPPGEYQWQLLCQLCCEPSPIPPTGVRFTVTATAPTPPTPATAAPAFTG